jgi:hypothetical protein
VIALLSTFCFQRWHGKRQAEFLACTAAGTSFAFNDFDLTLLLSLCCFGVEAFTTPRGFSEGLPCNFWLSTFCFQILATFCFQLFTLNNSFAFKVGDLQALLSTFCFQLFALKCVNRAFNFLLSKILLLSRFAFKGFALKFGGALVFSNTV